MNNNLPNDFLIEKDINEEQKRILLEQIERFNKIKVSGFKKYEPIVNEKNEVCLKEGMLIHGINVFNYDKVLNIKNTGILTGQALGIEEDGETFYCADFHRVDKDTTFNDYSMNFPYRDGRCPMGNFNIGKKTLAFIIDRDCQDDLFKYDCYREGTYESDITKTFINYMPMKKDVASSILYGVPSNLIEGIVIGNKLVEDKEVVKFLIDTFPNCYLIGKFGDLIYKPNNIGFNIDEYVELRRQMICLKNEKKELEKTLGDKEKELREEREKNQKIKDSMENNCDNLTLCRIYTEVGNIQMANYYLKDIEDKEQGYSR